MDYPLACKLRDLQSTTVITNVPCEFLGFWATLVRRKFNGSSGMTTLSNSTLPLEQHKPLHSSFRIGMEKNWQNIVGFRTKTAGSFL